MKLTILLPVLSAMSTFGLVHALPNVHARVDDRLLFQIPSFDGMSAFTDAWTDVCTLWPPFNTNGLPKAGFSLVSLLVEPGDFSGNNADTEAKVVCTWTEGAGLIPITTDVANAIGATLL
ncbi:hypothetical protein DFH08DRAFT_879937 [Mycena albidolilacea]|uniref:Uncharacterized protein n=1 Tax=Mycena albidolilacea TaxID=1033008 RepID=A0AAD6ZPX8_9AGAR|nr:hypothetical protein DFH08DRAFT_879937 [Mycena albidolilacea]